MSGSKSSDGSFARAASLPPEARAEHPLGLTVHTLPEAGEAVATAQRARHGRWKMLGVLLNCAAPVVASYFTYYVIRPEGRRVYGELINPQRTVPALTASTLNGAAMRLESLKGQWLLVSVAGGDCDPPCQKHLYLQRQLRESLGKEKDRLDWVWLVSDQAPIPADIEPGLKQATVVRADQATLNAWLQPAAGKALADHLYVVDPMGHWMLRFPANMDKKSASQGKKDRDHLLRASSSWDNAGRGEEPKP